MNMDHFENQSIDLLREIVSIIERTLTDIYTPYGITAVQAKVLFVLNRFGDQTISDLSSKLDLGSNSLSPLCQRLEKSGYVKRVRGEQDERYVHVKLTDKGTEIMNKIHCDVGEQYLPCLTELAQEDKSKILEGLICFRNFLINMK